MYIKRGCYNAKHIFRGGKVCQFYISSVIYNFTLKKKSNCMLQGNIWNI